jgi:hypothetical protein
VKHICTSLALLGIIFASHAQQPTLKDSQGKQIDESNSRHVASPNRTSSREWARSHNPTKSTKDMGDKDSSKPAAVVWVDSTGKTVGRSLEIGGGPSEVLVTFENELIALKGLFPERNCDFNADFCTLTFSGGASWLFSSVQYTSTNCTGTPYISSAPNGRPINGVPILDNGETFIYLYNATQNTVQTIQSFFSNGRCSQSFGGSFPQNVSPVMAVVPASTFGITPFFLK